jgi:hypothetical protein
MERKSLIDMISGIAGALLLVLAIVLFAVVPQDEPVVPSFQVKYVPSTTTIPLDMVLEFSEADEFRSTRTQYIPANIDSNYIYRITFDVEWTDDVASSDPDRFQFKIKQPNGEEVTSRNVQRSFENEPPIASVDNSTGVPDFTYTPQLKEVSIGKGLGAPPRDGPVSGISLTETLEEARARLLADLYTYETGEWQLEVYLGEAGDCPPPQPGANADNTQSSVCTKDTNGSGEDTTNNIRIVSATYATYELEIEEK